MVNEEYAKPTEEDIKKYEQLKEESYQEQVMEINSV